MDEVRMTDAIRRGEMHWMDTGYIVDGEETIKSRPVIVVSNNVNNKYSDIVEVVYMTTNPKKNLHTHVHICSTSNGHGTGSVALCENVYSISKNSLQDDSYYGRVSDEDMRRIDEALMVSLGIESRETVMVAEQVDTSGLKAELKFYKAKYEQLLDKILEARL